MLTAVVTGCGAMSRGWLEAIAEHPEVRGRVRIVGLVDLDGEAAESLARDAGLDGVAKGTDLKAMLGEVKPDLLFDIVVPSARRSVVEIGLRHGCHVLSEKPLAVSLDDATAIVALAKDTGRVHAVMQNRRYVDGVRRIKAFVESEAIGPLTGVHADFFIGAHFGGFREHMQNPLLLDMAIHTFDAARFMIGGSPTAVYCHESNPRGSWYGHGAAANAIFEFDGDVVFTYRGSWCAEGAKTSWESAWRIVGTRGTLLWDGYDGFNAHVVSGDSGFLREVEPIVVPPLPTDAQTHGHASVIAEFVTRLERGEAPETVSSDNIQSLAMVFGAIESAAQKRRVEINESRNFQ